MRRRRRRRSVRPWRLAAILAVAVLGIAVAHDRPDRKLRAATGTAAEILCTESFLSQLPPADIYRQTLAPDLGHLVSNHLHWSVDAEHQQAQADWFGLFQSVAVFRGPAGCLLRHDGQTPAPPTLTPFAAASLPDIAGPQLVEPSDPRLVTALDHVFAEPAIGPPRQIEAVVVVRDGKVIAERYAPGVGIDAPLLGYSVSKLVINALASILVGQGLLQLDAPAPVAAWAAPDDPRHAITLDNLLRMTSGLAIPEEESGYDAVSRMLFIERDMAGFATRASLSHPPGTAWAYTSGNTLLVARMIANAAGGTESAVLDFARTTLFAPLGMHSAVITTDAAGTPVGSTFILASARDWARLGLLYLNDGVVAGRRVLPENWVAYTRRPTLGSDYGAGVFINNASTEGAQGRIRAGMPGDAFFASGRLGQRIYILPSQRLVVVRFGVSHAPDFDIAADLRLLREVDAAPR